MTRKHERNGLTDRRQQRKIRRRCWGAVMDVLVEHGFGGLARAVEILVNEAMLIERAAALEAAPYERSPLRRACAVATDRSLTTFGAPRKRRDAARRLVMHRILPHLTAAVLGLAPLALTAVATSDASAPQPAAISCDASCPMDACPMPSCCDGACPTDE